MLPVQNICKNFERNSAMFLKSSFYFSLNPNPAFKHCASSITCLLLFRCVLKEEAFEDILRNYDNKVVPIHSFDGKVLVFHFVLRVSQWSQNSLLFFLRHQAALKPCFQSIQFIASHFVCSIPLDYCFHFCFSGIVSHLVV